MPSIPTPATVTDEVIPVPPILDVLTHAASCGRLDCGHLAKSGSRAVRRATILYQAEGAGYVPDLDAEAPEVVSFLALLRAAQHARPIYRRNLRSVEGDARLVPLAPNEGLPLPDLSGLTMTPERVEVFGLLWLGYSATDIGTYRDRPGLTHRSYQTVKSHAGWLRRLTGAHDATSALVALALAASWEVTPGDEASAVTKAAAQRMLAVSV